MKKILAILFCALMLFGCKADKVVNIENFTNKSVEEATAYFEKLNIEYAIGYVESDYANKGTVLSQEIDANTVLLTVSKGKESERKYVENDDKKVCELVEETVKEDYCAKE